ncbi:DsbA family oxidoreductase [Nocardioides sp. GCM10027113]|uniref:DsbA family oxidoreductase n=1 Tax=unclassified Nocardioides TaxID=2615069 RepID=UPI003613C42A
MRIDIWSDVVCPWCYVGKRRLEAALADFGHADEVEVVWHSFQLEPGAPTAPTQSLAEHLGRKYGGGPDAGRQMIDRMEAVAAEAGLLFGLHRALPVGTGDAHRLLHLALDEGGPALQGRLKEALLSAYCVEARNVADHDVLRDVATGAGLDAARVDEVLGSHAYADAVQTDIDQAHAYGASGVPFYVVDGRYGVSGAQPSETFAAVLRRAWDERVPSLQLVGDAGSADGEVCGPDGCTP